MGRLAGSYSLRTLRNAKMGYLHQPPPIVLGTSLMSKYGNFGPNPIGRPYHPSCYLKKLEATKKEKKKEKIGTGKRKKQKQKKRKRKQHKEIIIIIIIIPFHSPEDSPNG